MDGGAVGPSVAVASVSPIWRHQALAFVQAFADAGCRASVCWPSHPLFCDALFCIGSGESLVPYLRCVSAKRRVLYLIEPTPAAHVGYLDRFTDLYVHSSINAWLPKARVLPWPAFPMFRPTGEPKDIDALFLGNLTARRYRLLDGSGIKVVTDVYGPVAASLYSRAKIVVNLHASDLPNTECRIVEALGCGAFVLSERLADGWFRPDEHFGYLNDTQLAAPLRYWLSQPGRRDRIAAVGHADAQEHFLSAAVARILEDLR